jgi:hypothetical protein
MASALNHPHIVKDHGLVFAKVDEDVQKSTSALGQPCLALVERHFRQVAKAAGVRPIKVPGTRHTVATLMLQTGTPVLLASR